MSKRRGRSTKPKNPKRKNSKVFDSTVTDHQDDGSVSLAKDRRKGNKGTTSEQPSVSKMERLALTDRGSGSSILTEPSEVNRDLRLLQRAARGKWNVKDRVKRKILRRMERIIDTPTAMVMTKEGPFESEAAADKLAMEAAKIIIVANGQDQSDDFKGKETVPAQVNVSVNNNNGPTYIDNRAVEIARLAESLGASKFILNGAQVDTGSVLGPALPVQEEEKSVPPSTKADNAAVSEAKRILGFDL